MSKQKRRSSPSNSLRIGWWDSLESVVDAEVPGRDTYALAIINHDTFENIASPDWQAALGRSNLVMNLAGNSDRQENVDLRGARVVNWGDAAHPRTAAAYFAEARSLAIKFLLPGEGAAAALVDAGCLSKVLLASVLGFLVRSRLVETIDVLYRRREYRYRGQSLAEVYAAGPRTHGINDIEFALSAIPYVEGRYASGKRRHCIVLCGLDFQRILGKVRELEPARISVIIEAEAVQNPASKESFEKVCGFLGIDSHDRRTVSRTDVHDVIECISEAIDLAREQDLHTVMVAGGGKPSALAATLQSILSSEAPMLATIPDRVVDLESSYVGATLLYRLRDWTSLPPIEA